MPSDSYPGLHPAKTTAATANEIRTHLFMMSILLYRSVAPEQETTEEKQTPGFEPGNFSQAEDAGHEPVPQQHHRQAHQRSHDKDKPNNANDHGKQVHFQLLCLQCL